MSPAPGKSAETKFAVPVLRLAITVALVMAALFTATWSATQVFMAPSDLFVELFTSSSPDSADAFAEGILWATWAGFAAGALAALIYNALRILGRN